MENIDSIEFVRENFFDIAFLPKFSTKAASDSGITGGAFCIAEINSPKPAPPAANLRYVGTCELV